MESGIMEYLIVAIILYFILQTAGNLVYILRGGGNVPQSASARSHDWQGPSPREQTEGLSDRPTFWGSDVEEARWTDIPEGAD